MIIDISLLSFFVLLTVFVLPVIALGIPRCHRPGLNYDVIIVLGCRVDAEGNPGMLLRARVDKGTELYRAGAAPRLLMTGSAVYNRHVEAEVMARYAESSGVSHEDIVLETQARNTRENATFSAEILRSRGWRRALVVTSASHVWRSAYLFRRARVRCRVAAARNPRGFPLRRRLLLWSFEWYLLNRIIWQRFGRTKPAPPSRFF